MVTTNTYRQTHQRPTGLSNPLTMRSLRFILNALFLSLVCFGSPSAAQAQTAEQHIVIVRVTQEKSSDRLIRGIKSQLKQSNLTVKFSEVSRAGIVNAEQALPDSLRKLHPDLIITIGSGITEIVSSKITDIPVVFAGVFHPEQSDFVASRKNPGGNVTGASLDVSPDIQFKYFKQVYPELKTLGILYSQETAKLIPHAKTLALSQGITLRAVEIGAAGSGYERDVYQALDTLLPQVDGLWSLADPNVFSLVGTKMIIKQTLMGKVPFMGFSSTIVASGALFAIDIDYKDVGRQAGALADRVLTGEPISKISVTIPRVNWFHYNENTARRVAASIPEELQVVAKEVHK